MDVRLPIERLKPLCLETRLDRVIVAPAAAYAAAGERLARALRQRFTADVIARDGHDAAASDPGAADPSRTAIVLGDLSTHPLIARLYHAYLCWTDRRYPGPGGFELRTLHNPFGRGGNLVLLGCSDAAGAVRAVDRLLDAARLPILPPMLDVELADAADAQWRAGAGNTIPYRPGLSDGLRYYLTGRQEFGQAYRQRLLSFDPRALPEQVAGQHMVWLFDMALWDLIEEQPLFTDADRLRITNFYLALARSDEGIGYVDVPEIMQDDGLRQNHHTNTAFALWLAARYFDRDYPNAPGVRDDVARWRRAAAQAFRPGRAASRGQCETWHEWEYELDINFDYFAAVDDPAYVDSGALRAAAERILLSCANTGTIANSGDIFPWQLPPPLGLLGKAAFAYGDPRYRFFTRRKTLFLHRAGLTTMNAVGREYEDGLAPVRPDDHLGVRYCLVDPAFHAFHGHAPRFYRERMFLETPNVPASVALDKLAFRGGWSPDDQYLLIDGVSGGSHGHEDANAILQFDEFGRSWLVDGDFRGPGVARHNALSVAADGEGSPLPAFAEKACVAGLESLGFSHTILRDYGGLDWGRAVVWLRGQAFLVLDRATARASDHPPAACNLALRWWALGERAPGGGDGRLTVVQRAPIGARATAEALHIDTLLGEARAGFEAPDGEYRLRVDLRVTRATTWANSVVFDFDGRYPAEFIIGDRLDPPGQVDQAVLEGIVRLRGGPRHELAVRVGTALKAEVRGIELTSADGAWRLALPPASFQASQRLLSEATARFHIVPAAACEAEVASHHPALAEQWQRYPLHAVGAGDIHALQQSAQVTLPAGQSFTFANLLYAETPSVPRAFGVQQIGDGLVRLTGGEEAVAGFGPLSGPPTPFGARTDAALVFLSRRRVAAAAVTRFESSGIRLRSDAPVSFEVNAGGRAVIVADAPTGVHLRVAGRSCSMQLDPGRHEVRVEESIEGLGCSERSDLSTAEGAREEKAGRSQRSASRPAARWLSFDAPLLSLARWGSGWVAGDAAGTVRALDGGGREAWRFDAGGAVNTLCTADVDGDGAPEVVAGCEDCHVHLLGSGGGERWRRRFGVLPATYGLYAGLGQIRRVHVDDLDADGQPEIYVSPDNMHLHALSADGEERWRMISQYGPFTAYRALDLYGEGRRVLAGGMSRNTCHSAVQVIDASGQYVDLYVNDGWTSSLGDVWAGDLDGDGRLEILAGTNRGWLRLFDARPRPLGRPMPPFQGDVTMKSFEWAEPRDRIRWARHLGGPVQAVAAFAGLALGGSEAGFVTAFDPAGRKRWFVQAGGPVARLLADGPRCVALTRNGGALIIDPDGRVRDRTRLGGSPAAAELADNQCVVACDDGGIYVL